MGDNTSAGIFSELFSVLNSTRMDPKVKKQLAEHFLSMSRGYDFATYELEADDLLRKLGLAKLDKGGGILYKGEDYD